MRIGAFEISEPVPDLNEPEVIAVLSPWMDAGRAGTIALSHLEEHFRATELAKLATPGGFFDFTRYRPTIKYVKDERVTTLPKSTLSYVKRRDGSDLLFFHLLEPHAAAEEYIESILELIKTIGVKRYCRVGASYGAVPHTRPLPVNQSIRGMQVDRKTGELVPRNRRYQGPTSIMNMVTDGIEDLGIETMTLSVRLPYYAQLEEDYTGVARLLEAISGAYDLPPMLVDTISLDKARGERQYRRIDGEVDKYPDVKAQIQRLESDFDSESSPAPAADDPTSLSPEMEQFLRDVTGNLGES